MPCGWAGTSWRYPRVCTESGHARATHCGFARSMFCSRRLCFYNRYICFYNRYICCCNGHLCFCNRHLVLPLWSSLLAAVTTTFASVTAIFCGYPQDYIDRAPGELGEFGALAKPVDEEEWEKVQMAELKHGRLAMLAVVGCFAQEVVTGQGPVEQLLSGNVSELRFFVQILFFPSKDMFCQGCCCLLLMLLLSRRKKKKPRGN